MTNENTISLRRKNFVAIILSLNKHINQVQIKYLQLSSDSHIWTCTALRCYAVEWNCNINNLTADYFRYWIVNFLKSDCKCVIIMKNL